MTIDYLLTWMMVFLRSLGVILQLPVLAGRPLPVMVRLGICVCLATLLAGVVPSAVVPVTLWALLIATAGEVLLGLTLGFVGRLAFASVEMAGRMMSSEIGLSATPGLGAPEPATAAAPRDKPGCDTASACRSARRYPCRNPAGYRHRANRPRSIRVRFAA